MLSSAVIEELRRSWLPNMTDGGLTRVIELLEKGSPILIQGDWCHGPVMGCLASHAAWHHPMTMRLGADAGGVWLAFIVGIDPRESQVLQSWDCSAPHDWQTRAELCAIFRDELVGRQDRFCRTDFQSVHTRDGLKVRPTTNFKVGDELESRMANGRGHESAKRQTEEWHAPCSKTL